MTSAITLCFGHSVGMHRRLIHTSFDCPSWLERFCVYLGTLVGMAVPYGMVRLHDFRDWAQRQAACHAYSRHAAGFWRDAWWQLHCTLVLKHPPVFPRTAACKRPLLCLRRANLDVAAIALGLAVFCDRFVELAGLGHLRPGRRLRHRSLADRSTITAENGKQGILMARHKRPDVILMDIVMPEINGFQATRYLSRHADTAHIPIIIISGSNQESDKAWGLKLGARDFLRKPVDKDELFTKIAALINERNQAERAKNVG